MQRCKSTYLETSINIESCPKQSVEFSSCDEAFLQDARKLFAFNLRRLLARPGFNNTGLASYLDVQPQMVSRWLQGRILPTKHLEAIAAYLKVHIGELFAAETPLAEAVTARELTQEEWLRGLAKSLGYSIRRIRLED